MRMYIPYVHHLHQCHLFHLFHLFHCGHDNLLDLFSLEDQCIRSFPSVLGLPFHQEVQVVPYVHPDHQCHLYQLQNIITNMQTMDSYIHTDRTQMRVLLRRDALFVSHTLRFCVATLTCARDALSLLSFVSWGTRLASCSSVSLSTFVPLCSICPIFSWFSIWSNKSGPSLLSFVTHHSLWSSISFLSCLSRLSIRSLYAQTTLIFTILCILPCTSMWSAESMHSCTNAVEPPSDRA